MQHPPTEPCKAGQAGAAVPGQQLEDVSSREPGAEGEPQAGRGGGEFGERGGSGISKLLQLAEPDGM